MFAPMAAMLSLHHRSTTLVFEFSEVNQDGIAEAPEWFMNYILSGGKSFEAVAAASIRGLTRKSPSHHGEAAPFAIVAPPCLFVRGSRAHPECLKGYPSGRARDLVSSRRGFTLDRLGRSE